MKTTLFILGIALLTIGCGSKEETVDSSKAAESTPVAATTFAAVAPTFNKFCVSCHGDKGKAGIDLRSYESVIKGGEAGPIVKAGDPDNSLLIHAIQGSHGAKKMPMNAEPLSDGEQKVILDWVKGGAKA